MLTLCTAILTSDFLSLSLGLLIIMAFQLITMIIIVFIGLYIIRRFRVWQFTLTLGWKGISFQYVAQGESRGRESLEAHA
jgi:hypothetical protein